MKVEILLLKERKAIPTDYGAYWTSFYLSPVFGALAAWAGILLIVGLVELNLLSGPFERVQWGGIAYHNGVFCYFTTPDILPYNQGLTDKTQTNVCVSTCTACASLSENSTDESVADNEDDGGQPLAISFQLQFSFSTDAQTAATQEIAAQNAKTTSDDTQKGGDPNGDVLLTLAFALILGFSERLLAQLTTQLAGAFETKKEEDSK